ncbi:endolytic transglycosylase MltG [Entomospira culicis]|uniref:Endolytic murein transglycosylase n=1 Tax=Entomospira culicis TaxID=2719989 RepID=A0A968GGU3_9SPIO|nr:endolytic transglycosylase MltG [Entomospira culicis]NIZ19272.1 endolytic transglycosylase MltG [Entomospira culicis]NIZ69823.1 endolytic transglycosylase MltG [Entomospira culicis]WDI36930.1 endolytic transglycosylase MltG [Entomospira culicis]WDI38559.1 endolytic transglycosylase MltG [Entomospira culicis]
MQKKSSVAQKILLGFLSLLLVFIMIAASYLLMMNSPARKDFIENQSPSTFEVKEGSSLYRIMEQLDEEGYIKSAFFLKLYHKFIHQEGRILAGTYAIPTNLTAIQTLHFLFNTAPTLDLIAITIPEGLTLREASLIWEEAGFFTSQEFLDASNHGELLLSYGINQETLEGWLFPDTYLVPATISAQEAVTLMLRQFFAVLTEIDTNWQARSPQELTDKIILASIVQKEHKVAEDAPLMASVFLNRLAVGDLLRTDATINYMKKERLGQGHARRVLYADLAIDDPFNSYKYAGLPPHPVGLSGRVALKAVFYPPQTDYYFFVAIPQTNGKHHFSVTYEEHLKHARIWQEWLNKNNIYS